MPDPFLSNLLTLFLALFLFAILVAIGVFGGISRHRYGKRLKAAWRDGEDLSSVYGGRMLSFMTTLEPILVLLIVLAFLVRLFFPALASFPQAKLVWTALVAAGLVWGVGIGVVIQTRINRRL